MHKLLHTKRGKKGEGGARKYLVCLNSNFRILLYKEKYKRSEKKREGRGLRLKVIQLDFQGGARRIKFWPE
jgi:hypothetical protein